MFFSLSKLSSVCNLLGYVLLSINVFVCLIAPLCNGSGTIHSFHFEEDNILARTLKRNKDYSKKVRLTLKHLAHEDIEVLTEHYITP